MSADADAGPAVRRPERLATIREAVRGYEVLAALIVAGLVVTWPGLYSDPAWNQIMTNAFATFLVLPILIFGVDRALVRARRLREYSRHEAIRAELEAALSTTVSIGVTGTIVDLLPGVIDEVAERVRTGDIDAGTEYTALSLIERKGEMERAVAELRPDELRRLIGAVAAQRLDLRELLFEAGSSLSTDLYAQILGAAQRVANLQGTERLLEFATSAPKQYDLDSENGRTMRAVIARDFVSALVAVAAVYIDMQSGRT